jgi:hypothetical protein
VEYTTISFGWCYWIDWGDWALPLHIAVEPQNEAVFIHILFLNISIWRRTNGNGTDSSNRELEDI